VHGEQNVFGEMRTARVKRRVWIRCRLLRAGVRPRPSEWQRWKASANSEGGMARGGGKPRPVPQPSSRLGRSNGFVKLIRVGCGRRWCNETQHVAR